jgi:hypothetical protein
MSDTAIRRMTPPRWCWSELLHILVILRRSLSASAPLAWPGLLVFGVRRRLGGAARVRSPLPWAVGPRPRLTRAALPLPQPPQPAIERPPEVHVRLHGVSAEEIAGILGRWDNPG